MSEEEFTTSVRKASRRIFRRVVRPLLQDRDKRIAALELSVSEILNVINNWDSIEGGDKYLDGFMVDWISWRNEATLLLGIEEAEPEIPQLSDPPEPSQAISGE